MIILLAYYRETTARTVDPDPINGKHALPQANQSAHASPFARPEPGL